MKKIYVLGMGDSLKEFTTKLHKEITIGVNYIWKYYPSDIVICIDRIKSLPEWKTNIICQGRQKQFISNYNEWESIVANYKHKPLSGLGRGNLKDIDDIGVLCYASNSIYSAVVHAYHLGATDIVMYGVDFNNHPAINGKFAETEISRIINLRNVLKERNVNLFVGSEKSKLHPQIEILK